MNTLDGILRLKTEREVLERITFAAGRVMTAEEKFEQRVSWVWGQCDGDMTKEQVRQMLQGLGDV